MCGQTHTCTHPQLYTHTPTRREPPVGPFFPPMILYQFVFGRRGLAAAEGGQMLCKVDELSKGERGTAIVSVVCSPSPILKLAPLIRRISPSRAEGWRKLLLPSYLLHSPSFCSLAVRPLRWSKHNVRLCVSGRASGAFMGSISGIHLSEPAFIMETHCCQTCCFPTTSLLQAAGTLTDTQHQA